MVYISIKFNVNTSSIYWTNILSTESAYHNILRLRGTYYSCMSWSFNQVVRQFFGKLIHYLRYDDAVAYFSIYILRNTLMKDSSQL